MLLTTLNGILLFAVLSKAADRQCKVYLQILLSKIYVCDLTAKITVALCTITESLSPALLKRKTEENGSNTTPLPHIEILQGRDGRDGRDGVLGPRGLPGRNGKNAEKGVKGEPEAQGPPGPRSGGATYIRWGRTTCPNVTGTELVYKGRAAGSHYTQKGGTRDYLCLPDEPQYLDYQTGVQGYSPLHGAEYEVRTKPLHSVHNQNVPCSACHFSTRASVIMIPARLSCPNTWTLEYSGYLMSKYREYYRSSAKCVDKNPEAVPGCASDTNGALFHHMEASCNCILCPPYLAEKGLTCAVCTK